MDYSIFKLMSSTLERTHLENTTDRNISFHNLLCSRVWFLLCCCHWLERCVAPATHSEANNALLIPIPVVAKEEMIILNALCEQRNTGMLPLGCRLSGQGALLHLLNVSLHQ